MQAIEQMIELHRELVEVGKEHNDAYDAFGDDDNNWISKGDDEEFDIPKTGAIANRYEFLGKLCDNQAEAIAKSHAAFSQFASSYEDNSRRVDRKAEGQIAAFFSEFGI